MIFLDTNVVFLDKYEKRHLGVVKFVYSEMATNTVPRGTSILRTVRIDLIHEKKDLIRGNFFNEIFKWNVTNTIAIASTFVTHYYKWQLWRAC